MSQLLQVHINQRVLKSQSSGGGGGETNPSSPGMLSSPGTMSPLSMGPSSPQGMPIPSRRLPEQHMLFNPGVMISGNIGPTEFGNWSNMGIGMNMNFDSAMESLDFPNGNSENDPLSMEGELSKLSMAVDEDDIFKMERNDLLGPTLAELNAPDADTLLDGLNFDDLYWPADAHFQPVEATPSPQTPVVNPLDPDGDFVPFQVHVPPSSSFPPLNKLLPAHTPGTSVPVSSGPTILEQTLMQPVVSLSEINFSSNVPSSSGPQPSSSSGGLRELLLRRELQNSIESPDSASQLGQSLPRQMLSPSPGPQTPRLSSSAPTGQGNNAWESWQQRREAVWSRRDPKPHLLSTGSLAEDVASSLSADVLSPGREFSLSMDEGFDSDDISDRDSTDEESDVSDTESNAGSTTRRERFFWQYNVQAKGPKGQRLVLAPTQEDPHVLHRPTDPVFSPLCHIQGIKHSGKARKGDGNDLTPNPKKLWAIGKELDRLNKVIAEMTPVADLPNAVKSKSRKEKNKLASRACRLKKKAQHEANKLKLFGLEQEHKRLITAIDQSRQLIFSQMDGSFGMQEQPESFAAKMDRISKYGTRHKIGGHTTEFVNKVLERVKQGVPDGGISEL